jgi:hypothetical protein
MPVPAWRVISLVPKTVCRQQHDPCAPHVLLRAVPIGDDGLQSRSLSRTNLSGNLLAHARSPAASASTQPRTLLLGFTHWRETPR